MSDAVFNNFARGMSRLNTSLQSKFGRDGARCFLLRRSQQKGIFETVAELTTGFYVEPDKLRNAIFLYLSTIEEIEDKWTQATHIGYGVPLSNEIFVFEIQIDQKDEFLPDASNSDYKAFAIRSGKDRYTIVEGGYTL